MLPRALTDRIINETDIVEVISSYVPLKPKGKGFWGVCPFHEDTNPSMSVTREKKMFNCFSCGTKGNVIYFVSRFENISLDQAGKKLATRLGIKIDERVSEKDLKTSRLLQVMDEATNFYQFYLSQTVEGQKARDYLAKRGINDELIKKFRIGLAPDAGDYLNQALNKKNIDLIDQLELGLVIESNSGQVIDAFRGRIIFPLNDLQGNIVGFSGRIYYPKENAPKYLNSPENDLFHKGNTLYNYHHAQNNAKRLDRLYLFEGFMDVIAAEKAGVTNAVASMGTALTREQVKAMSQVTKNIIMCFDGDYAGVVATRRGAEILVNSNIVPQAVPFPNDMDADEYYNAYGTEALLKHLQLDAVNAYEYLYNLAAKELEKTDINSVQRFKNEITTMLKRINSPVIVDFFINKLANDLGIKSSDLLKEVKYAPSMAEQAHEVVPKAVVVSKAIPRKVYIAYETIIKYSISDAKYYYNYFEKTDNAYPGASLDKYYVICQVLNEYYQTYKQMDIAQFKERLSINKVDAQLIDRIMQDEAIMLENNEYFNDCLRTIEQYFIACRDQDLYNQALNTETALDQYLREIQKHKTPIKEGK